MAQIDGDRIPFIKAAFAAYWQDHQNLNDEDIVRGLIPKTAAHHFGALSTARSVLDDIQKYAATDGIVDTPAFVVDRHVFIGREHLPWIEEILRADKTGQTP